MIWTAAQVTKVIAEHRHAEDFVVTECKNGPTWTVKTHLRMDLVAIKKSWTNPLITAYEIKISRSDFHNDNKWPDYMPYCDCFYFASPKGVITKEDIEAIEIAGVGLVHVYDSGTVRTVVRALNRHVKYSADMLMHILMSKVESDKYPFHSDKADFFRSWVQNKESNRVLGKIVGTEMARRVEDMHIKCRDLELKNMHAREFVAQLKEKYGIQNVIELQSVFPDLKLLTAIPGGYEALRAMLTRLRRLSDNLKELGTDKFPKW